jgi:hypothetical protein
MHPHPKTVCSKPVTMNYSAHGIDIINQIPRYDRAVNGDVCGKFAERNGLRVS